MFIKYLRAPVKYLIFIGVFLLNSCSTTKQPNWLTSDYRIDKNYYHGYSKVTKTGTSSEYIGLARTQSLGAIAQAIKAEINVKTLSKIKEIEKTGNKNSYILEESFEIISSVRSKLTLEGVESLGEWESQNYYFVYNRLSKKIYQDILNKKIFKALRIARHNLNEGNNLSQENPTESLKYYITGLKELIPYQDQTLVVNEFDNNIKSINIDFELRRKIQSILFNISINPLYETNQLKFGKINKDPIKLKILYKDRPMKNIPIIFSFISDESGYIEKDISDSKGMFNCNIQTFNILKNFYQINAAVDLTQFTGSDNIGKYLLSEFKNILIPNITFDIEILPINIYLNIDEKSFGNILDNPLVTPKLIKSLEKQMEVIFVDLESKADFVLEIEIDTKQRGEAYSLYSSVAEMSVYLKNENNILFANSFNDIKGTHSDYKKASREALRKLSEKVEKEISNQIIQHILN